MLAAPVRFLKLAALALAATLAGCSDGVSFPAGLAGNFTLVTANGQALPYTLPGTGGGVGVTLLDGSLVLLANGRFTETLHYFLVTPDNPNGSRTPSVTIGDVSVSGGSITFKPVLEDRYSGSISANTVTYTKQSNQASLALSFTRSQ